MAFPLPLPKVSAPVDVKGGINMSYSVGVDLGGTKILIALADGQCKVMKEKRLLTRPERGPSAIIQEMIQEVHVLLESCGVEEAELKGIGVCIAGFYDSFLNIMRRSPNLPGWEMFPVKDAILQLVNCPVLVENDASAAAYGEYLYGSGKGVKHLTHITLGTGIGCGLILDGHLYRGSRGFAGELGHIQLLPDGPLCGCGRRGCFEVMASGTAIARQGRRLLETGRKTMLQQLVPKGDIITASHVFHAAEVGDSEANQIIKEAAYYLGCGLSVVTNLLNPERITLGGGLSQVGGNFIEEAKGHFLASAVDVSSETVDLVRAELTDKAGVLGIIALLNEQ